MGPVQDPSEQYVQNQFLQGKEIRRKKESVQRKTKMTVHTQEIHIHAEITTRNKKSSMKNCLPQLFINNVVISTCLIRHAQQVHSTLQGHAVTLIILDRSTCSIFIVLFDYHICNTFFFNLIINISKFSLDIYSISYGMQPEFVACRNIIHPARINNKIKLC